MSLSSWLLLAVCLFCLSLLSCCYLDLQLLTGQALLLLEPAPAPQRMDSVIHSVYSVSIVYSDKD